MPSRCPVCETPVVRDEGEAMHYCPNAACPGRQLEAIRHFASKGASDIRGLGDMRLAQLVEAGLVKDVADLLPDSSADHLLPARGLRRRRAPRNRWPRSRRRDSPCRKPSLTRDSGMSARPPPNSSRVHSIPMAALRKHRRAYSRRHDIGDVIPQSVADWIFRPDQRRWSKLRCDRAHTSRSRRPSPPTVPCAVRRSSLRTLRR